MLLLKIIFIAITLELMLQLIIRKAKKKFPWFINKNDLHPTFNEKKFKRYRGCLKSCRKYNILYLYIILIIIDET